MINAVILSAGRGVRFDRERPKQLVEICGKPLFMHALDLYRELPGVDRVVLVVNPDTVTAVARILGERSCDDVSVVTGGATRQQSIGNALRWLAENGLVDDDLVVLHNGASPNTPPELVRRCLAAAGGADVVQAYAPALFTTFEIDGANMGAVLPRENLGYSCDPTVYRARALRRALEWQAARGLGGDSTIDAVRAQGVRVALVRSPYTNIKVTTPWELEAVRGTMANDE